MSQFYQLPLSGMVEHLFYIYLHFLQITKIILLKCLPSAIMLKPVSKFGNWWICFGLFTVYRSVMMSQHMTS